MDIRRQEQTRRSRRADFLGTRWLASCCHRLTVTAQRTNAPHHVQGVLVSLYTETTLFLLSRTSISSKGHTCPSRSRLPRCQLQRITSRDQVMHDTGALSNSLRRGGRPRDSALLLWAA
jgi:hypothetical protein